MAKLPENKEFEALISLLDEPDEEVFFRIREKIISLGRDVIPYLEHSWEGTLNKDIQERLEDILHQIQMKTLYADLQIWKETSSHDLLSAYLLITRYQYPTLDEDKITRQIGRITQDIWLELNNSLTALEKVRIFNRVFYEFNHFKGNIQNIFAPENLYLNCLLETHNGNPLSLGVLYSIIAQSLKMPVYGVLLPEHFILAYMKEGFTYETLLQNKGEVFFYINPFNHGEIFTRNEVDAYLKQMDLVPKRMFYYPNTNLQIVKLMFDNLLAAYSQMESENKVDELRQLAKALD